MIGRECSVLDGAQHSEIYLLLGLLRLALRVLVVSLCRRIAASTGIVFGKDHSPVLRPVANGAGTIGGGGLLSRRDVVEPNATHTARWAMAGGDVGLPITFWEGSKGTHWRRSLSVRRAPANRERKAQESRNKPRTLSHANHSREM